MRTPDRSDSTPYPAARVMFAWFGVGAAVTTPLWLTLGVWGLLGGYLGPLIVLLYKPGDQIAGKLLIAACLAVPVLLAAAWLRRADRSPTGPRRRLLAPIVLSLAWHLPGSVAMILILTQLN